jgi:hypothetical protein
VAGLCEHGHEPSSSIKCWEFLDCLRDPKFLKKDSFSMQLVILVHSLFFQNLRVCIGLDRQVG